MPDTALYSTPRETSINEDSFISDIINEEKDTNNEIFNEYFGYQNPSFSAKYVMKTDQFKSKQIVKKTIDSIND